MRILITGGLGLVGSHLADALLKEGCHVTIVDNLSSNVMSPEHYEKRCRVVVGSIEECYTRFRTPKLAFDEIYHLASVVGPAAVLKHAGDMARSIVSTGHAVNEIASWHDARLIAASTSEVYGRSGQLRETDVCQVPAEYTVRLEYASAKLTCEIASLNRARVSGLKVNIVRPFNIAGPRQLPAGGFVLPRFVTAALTGRPLTVFGTGQQVRAFTDVRDIVTGLIRLNRWGQSGLVLNLGNPTNQVSMLALAKLVIKLAGSRSPIKLIDPQELFGPLYAEGFERVPVVEAAREIIGWAPAIGLEQTILDTIEWYRQRHTAEAGKTHLFKTG